MKIFQNHNSLLSANYLEDVLQANYGLDDLECHLLVHSISDVYLLENSFSKYIFKIYQDKHRNLEEIEAEVELLNILHLRKAKVAYPITDKEGKQIQNLNTDNGQCYGVMFSYANGKVYFNMNDQQLETLGREMATIHNITSGLELNHHREEFHLDTLIIEPLKRIKPEFIELEDEYIYPQKATAMVKTKLEQIDLSLFSYGYCHYDLLPVNFHFEDDGTITIFDFDHLVKGHLVNDLVSFYAHYFLQMMFGRATQNEANYAFGVFIKSYCKIRPLSDAEIKSIPYFGLAFWIYYIAFGYEHFNDRSGTDYLKQQISWIKNWVDWYIGPITPSI